MEKCKKRKISEENRTFNDAWADSFAFTSDESGLSVCLICGETETFNFFYYCFFKISKCVHYITEIKFSL